MLPLTLLATQKFSDLLTTSQALEQQISKVAESAGASVPAISADRVVMTSVNPDIGDMNVQLTYPRVCLYSNGLKNAQTEKFRSLSGTVSVVAEVWASGNIVTQTDLWIHYYVEALTGILRENFGDWGNGLFFSGVYDVQFQPPKKGGFGFVQSAKVACNLNVSIN